MKRRLEEIVEGSSKHWSVVAASAKHWRELAKQRSNQRKESPLRKRAPSLTDDMVGTVHKLVNNAYDATLKLHRPYMFSPKLVKSRTACSILQPNFSRTLSYKHSYFNRITSLWSALAEPISTKTFLSFKVTVQFETEGNGQNEAVSYMYKSEVKL